MKNVLTSSTLLKKILECLNEDMISLHSCLLVNKDWSEIAVEILWRDIYIIQARANEIYGIDLEDESDQNILSTLYSCLPKESHELLKRNEIMIESPTMGSPKYNYPGYCKFLDTGYINQLIIVHLGEESEIYERTLLKQEIYQMFIKQSPSLYYLHFHDPHIPLPYFSGVNVCITQLKEFSCDTSISPSIFCRMAQLCRNIDKLLIKWVKEDNEGLAKLIEVQNNLRQVGLECEELDDLEEEKKPFECVKIGNAFTSQVNSLSHLYIKNSLFCIPLLPISKLTKLTSLELNLEEIFPIALLESLCSIHFPNLTKLLIGENIPPLTLLANFIKINGNTLKELLLYNGFPDGDPEDCTILNQMISRFCSELEILMTFCHDEQFHDIEDILISCEKLDSLILRNSSQDKIDATYLFTTLLATAPQYNLSRICVDSSIQFTYIILSSFLDIMNKKKHLLFYIYKSGGIRYVGYDGITNDHLAIIEKVGGGVLDEVDIMNEFSTTPQFRNPYRYSLE
ncbi:11480_t:CDS:1 [Funneliformis geosporum]|uniref:11480_t:CDS:1 n=1 Tax=Funneliformis geosporum TaxID=1117311 RepID=A0A9W4STI2_9GLOM|nr:11480_t:CDS:1 [Funneliformis geosporum]